MESSELIHAGIDAVTIVSRETIVGEKVEFRANSKPNGSAVGRSNLRHLARVTSEVSFRDEPRRSVRERGGEGWQQGSCRYTSSDNSRSTLKVSKTCKLAVLGHASDATFWLALDMDENVKITRIDLFADVRLARPEPRYTDDVYDGLPKKTQEKCEWRGNKNGRTLYVGSRRSPTFLRVYDKSLEYGEGLGNIWRFEIESKRYKAEYVRAGLEENHKSVRPYILQCIKNFCSKNNVHFPYHSDVDLAVVENLGITINTENERFQWFLTNIAPQVKRWLDSEEYSQAAFDACDLGRYTVK